MRVKRRRKSSRHAGSQTHGRGAKERTRGSGNRGGYGMAGTGKRGDQKKTLVIKLFGNDYFGKSKTLRRGKPPVQLKVINLDDINERIAQLVKNGIAKDNKGTYDINLKGYKVLGSGELKIKANISASAASESAMEKVKSAGGNLSIIEEEKEE